MKFKNPLFLAILTICLSTFQTFACLQAAGDMVVGKQIPIEGVPVDEFVKNFLTHDDRAHWEKIQNELKSQEKIYPFFSRNNLAVALIHLGQIQEAIKILEELEQKKPGEYFTAANLGTAYELNGENRKALDWIKEGIKRKRESHFGTEWLHVKILEAKLAMEKDGAWLKNNSVLGADFSGANQTPPKIIVTDFTGQEKSLAEIKEALVYQLHERLEFVRAPEPIVAGLLADLSKVFTALKMPEHAEAIEKLALDYGAGPAVKTKAKDTAPPEITPHSPSNYYLYIAAVVLALLGAVYFFIRKRALR